MEKIRQTLLFTVYSVPRYQSVRGGRPCPVTKTKLCPKSIRHFVFKFNKLKINNGINKRLNQTSSIFQSEITFVGLWNHIYCQKEKKRPTNFWTKFENSNCSGNQKQASQNRHQVTLSIKTKKVIFFGKIIFPYKLLYWKLAFLQITTTIPFHFKKTRENSVDGKN